MKQQKWMIVLAGALLLNTMYWQEALGINVLLTFIFILSSNFKSTGELIRTKMGATVIGCCTIACAMLLIHNSIVSMIATFASLIILIGYLHFPKLRTTYSAMLSGLIDAIKVPEVFISESDDLQPTKKKLNLKFVRLVLIPLIVFCVFVAIFYGANLYFRTAIDDLFSGIANFFELFFDRISILRILFFFLCFFISSWIVFKGVQPLLEKYDIGQSDSLFRKKRQPWNIGAIAAGKRPQFGVLRTLGLKNENLSSSLMIVAICCLLLLINCIDIVTVWFGYSDASTTNFSQEVHEGVNYLIASILLSIAILLYVFRGNQNFYTRKKRLVIWANFWMLQNAILIISVIIRNYYYIAHQGITHKRIGVYIFLIIVILGLVSLYRKINQSKSFYFMSKFNSWSIYLVLIAMTTVNWDLFIVRYNVQHRSSIEMDPYYLCSLSDETVLYLWKSKAELNQWEAKSHYRKDIVTPILERRIAKIQHEQSTNQNRSFLSWNYRSHWMKQELKGIPHYRYEEYYRQEEYNEF